jgi:hypothetical protein
MLIGLCLTTSTIHGYLRITFAISINLSLRSSHFLTHYVPNAPSSGHSLNNSSASAVFFAYSCF